MNLYSSYWVALERLLSEGNAGAPIREQSQLAGLHDIPELTTRQEMLELLARCIEHQRDKSLALKLGQSLQIMSLGLLGLAVVNCRTITQVARLLVRHSPLRSSGARLRLVETEQALKLSFIEPKPPVPTHPYLAHELFFSSVVGAMNRLTGNSLDGACLELAGPGHQSPEAYSALIGIPVETNCALNQLVIGKQLANTEFAVTVGDASAELNLRLYESLLRHRAPETGFAGSVQSIMLRSIGQSMDAKAIAEALNMSERTLRRRLDEEGASLRTLRHNLLKQVACQYLESTDLSVAEIGDMLGFSEYPNFRRAFLHWTGHSPARHRALKNLVVT